MSHINKILKRGLDLNQYYTAKNATNLSDSPIYSSIEEASEPLQSEPFPIIDNVFQNNLYTTSDKSINLVSTEDIKQTLLKNYISVKNNITPIDNNITPIDNNITPIDNNITPIDNNVQPQTFLTFMDGLSIEFSKDTNPLFFQLANMDIKLNYDDIGLHSIIRSKKINPQERNVIQYFLDHCTNLENKFIYVVFEYDIHNVDYSELSWIIDEINEYKSRALQNGKTFIFAIDAIGASFNYNFMQKNLDYIAQQTNMQAKDFLLISAMPYQNDNFCKYCFSPNITFAYRDIFKNDCGILPNYHFVSLARIPREHRIIATVEILNRNLQSYGNMSLGSGQYFITGENPIDETLHHFLPLKFRNYFRLTYHRKYDNVFPMYIDEKVDNFNENNKKMMDTTDEKITTAFINFVLETTFERILDPEIKLPSWENYFPLVSEKSVKPFAYGQVPIFVSFYHNVKYLREYGFDLFDDLIDHSYDNEPDPLTRILMCVEQLHKICNWKLEDCRKFKQNNIERFVNNQKILQFWERNNYKISVYNLQNVLDSYDN